MSDIATTEPHDPNIKHMADDINTPMLIVSAIISVVVTLLLVMALQAIYYYYLQKDHQAKVIDVEYREAARLQDQQRLRLNGPVAWADQKAGTVTVPIDRAMSAIVKQYQKTE